LLYECTSGLFLEQRDYDFGSVNRGPSSDRHDDIRLGVFESLQTLIDIGDWTMLSDVREGCSVGTEIFEDCFDVLDYISLRARVLERESSGSVAP
jgi:hypothetical protein